MVCFRYIVNDMPKVIPRMMMMIIHEMGGACSADAGEERHIQGFGGET
jgi:hypothetical protein